MAQKSYLWVLWTLAMAGTLLDQGSKYEVFKWLYDDQGRHGSYYEVVPGAFRIVAEYTTDEPSSEDRLRTLKIWSAPKLPRVNHGALFGLGGEQFGANSIFAVVSLIAVFAILWWSRLASTRRDFFLCAALGLILAGTLGNLYDRLIFNGVRDFFYFYWIEWPVFNVADCCLVCGAGLLLAQAFWGRAAVPESRPATVALSREMAEVK